MGGTAWLSTFVAFVCCLAVQTVAADDAALDPNLAIVSEETLSGGFGKDLLAKCPASYWGTVAAVVVGHPENCARAPWRCSYACHDKDASACFRTGLALQEWEATQDLEQNAPEASERFFARACQLGSAIGCVNRSAVMFNRVDGLSVGRDTAYRCTLDTFDRACGEGIAWGCSMAGMQVLRGFGVRADTVRAKDLFSRTCRLEPNGRACSYARSLADE